MPHSGLLSVEHLLIIGFRAGRIRRRLHSQLANGQHHPLLGIGVAIAKPGHHTVTYRVAVPVLIYTGALDLVIVTLGSCLAIC
jgi:hypothetical protein